ncbi:hypothetical protein K435DRAFT_803600 [Dendrothele bispora CBS 962.96]|uniref:Uncharacterized protein n=2 Tax=Dendrothele bispora (strain CBS 962.96) TaxID=1314807 RepID=A0A4S8LIB9_DENBC|nr:hypothetical protein K435DRAFT_803600 [Dendrothele bispora CBS 962.96]
MKNLHQETGKNDGIPPGNPSNRMEEFPWNDHPIGCIGAWKRVPEVSIEERNEFDMECNRVKWFRARADMERWQEEVEILCEEFRRAIRACDKMELVWRRLAETSEGKGQGYRGYRAYACHQAEVYRERGREGRAKFEAAGGTWPTAGTRLVDHLKAERPNWEIDWKGLKDISREEEDALRIVDVGDDVEDGLL